MRYLIYLVYVEKLDLVFAEDEQFNQSGYLMVGLELGN
jgi:hypothetical protein